MEANRISSYKCTDCDCLIEVRRTDNGYSVARPHCLSSCIEKTPSHFLKSLTIASDNIEDLFEVKTYEINYDVHENNWKMELKVNGIIMMTQPDYKNAFFDFIHQVFNIPSRSLETQRKGFTRSFFIHGALTDLSKVLDNLLLYKLSNSYSATKT